MSRTCVLANCPGSGPTAQDLRCFSARSRCKLTLHRFLSFYSELTNTPRIRSAGLREKKSNDSISSSICSSNHGSPPADSHHDNQHQQQQQQQQPPPAPPFYNRPSLDVQALQSMLGGQPAPFGSYGTIGSVQRLVMSSRESGFAFFIRYTPVSLLLFLLSV